MTSYLSRFLQANGLSHLQHSCPAFFLRNTKNREKTFFQQPSPCICKSFCIIHLNFLSTVCNFSFWNNIRTLRFKGKMNQTKQEEKSQESNRRPSFQTSTNTTRCQMLEAATDSNDVSSISPSGSSRTMDSHTESGGRSDKKQSATNMKKRKRVSKFY